MKILGIETSCDETGASVIEKKNGKLNLLSNSLASSVSLHEKTGGIIPENAAREQLAVITPVIREALENAKIKNPQKEIDAIAVTVGPGLIGSLLVGVETAKTLSYAWNVPIIPVNHLYGHLFANFINQTSSIPLPALCLIVSGGHTDLVLMKKDKKLEWIGGTRDDAAGEAFDKIGRLLSLPYPAGPKIEELAKKGKHDYNFPRPLIGSGDFDFSFSGLKTAVLREVKNLDNMTDQTINDICFSSQKAIVSVLIRKTLKAAKEFDVKSILLGGGVVANGKLREELEKTVDKDYELFIPPKNLCTDNGAMIAAAGFFAKPIPWKVVDASPSLHF